mmetsp:Transcript_33876/g.81926  ORF Transcript_33876/g.81926 Transcript_33876/m.81926 type:complete len:224 (-) Transcript_33876:101-772(-)
MVIVHPSPAAHPTHSARASAAHANAAHTSHATHTGHSTHSAREGLHTISQRVRSFAGLRTNITPPTDVVGISQGRPHGVGGIRTAVIASHHAAHPSHAPSAHTVHHHAVHHQALPHLGIVIQHSHPLPHFAPAHVIVDPSHSAHYPIHLCVAAGSSSCSAPAIEHHVHPSPFHDLLANGWTHSRKLAEKVLLAHDCLVRRGGSIERIGPEGLAAQRDGIPIAR